MFFTQKTQNRRLRLMPRHPVKCLVIFYTGKLATGTFKDLGVEPLAIKGNIHETTFTYR